MAPLSSTDLTEDKRALRREMGAKRAALPESERRARSDAASARFWQALESRPLRPGSVIGGYVAARGEIDPASVLAAAAAAGVMVALPRVDSEGSRLRFHRADAGALVPGRFGLLEPASDAPEVGIDHLDLVVVPGLAFDGHGGRLGFGGGFYDRTFGSLGRATLVGFAYDFQIVPRCPTGAGDVPVDAIVTDLRVLRPGEALR